MFSHENLDLPVNERNYTPTNQLTVDYLVGVVYGRICGDRVPIRGICARKTKSIATVNVTRCKRTVHPLSIEACDSRTRARLCLTFNLSGYCFSLDHRKFGGMIDAIVCSQLRRSFMKWYGVPDSESFHRSSSRSKATKERQSY